MTQESSRDTGRFTEPARSMATAVELAWRARPSALIGIVVLTLLTGSAPVAVAVLTKLVVDEASRFVGAPAPPTSADLLVLAAAGLVAALAVSRVLPPITQALSQELNREVRLVAEDRMFRCLGAMPGLAPFEDPGVHDRVQLAQQAGRQAPTQALSVLNTVAVSCITLVGFLSSLVLVSAPLAVLALAAVVPGLVGESRMSGRRVSLDVALSPRVRRQFFFSRLQTDPVAAKEIRIFGLSDFFRRRMIDEFRSMNREERALDLRGIRVQLGTGCVQALAVGVAIVVIVRGATSGAFGPGDIVLLLTAFTGLQSSSGGLIVTLGQLQQAVLMLGRYRSFLRDHESVPDGARQAPVLRQGIELRDVWFRYREDLPWVLRGVCLHIPAGSSVALVGLNGAGKSTVVKLLTRLYEPTHGRILWDGTDLGEFDPDSLRSRMGAVFQDFMDYDMTASENIGLGDLARFDDRDGHRRAARTALVDETIDRLRQGYDTMLSRSFAAGESGDRAGTTLSGGQWQRLAIARMLMREDRDLLLLDEPSSGLDVDAEHALHRQLRERSRISTSVLVSHRLNTVRHADHIVVIDDGVVRESGDHATLVAADGEYARMFRLQSQGYRDAGEASGRDDAPDGDRIAVASR